MHKVLERQLRRIGIGDGPPTDEQWRTFLSRVDTAYVEADQDRYTLERALDLSSTEMRKRYAELRDAQRRLIEASRKAGMADVAASVLHNIGNVLNSANTSATMISQTLRGTSRAGLGKVLTLLSDKPSPGEFIDKDPKGKKVLPYLATLEKTLGEQCESMTREAESLQKNIEHIKIIVSEQLALAKGNARGMVAERVDLDELLQDAINVVKTRASASTKFTREIGAHVLSTDRHKLLQIVTNLLANACDAVRDHAGGTVAIRTAQLDSERVAIEVIDDGSGIAKENLERIFNHGFTTKANGNGFGLHVSACSAIELGGALSAKSDGASCGATFTLTLPRNPPMSQRVPQARSEGEAA